MFEPTSFLAKVGQHSIMPSFEELIRVVYWGQFLVLTPTCCSHLLNPRFLWHNGVKYYLKLQYNFYSYTVCPPLKPALEHKIFFLKCSTKVVLTNFRMFSTLSYNVNSELFWPSCVFWFPHL